MDTELIAQKTSWGLMQVMGTVARELGHRGWLSELCEPERGIYYGCLHLKKLMDRHGNLSDTVAAYNAGSPRRDVNGKYVNQEYVDRFIRVLSEVGA